MNNIIDIRTRKPIDHIPDDGKDIRPEEVWECGGGARTFYLATDAPYCARCGAFLDMGTSA